MKSRSNRSVLSLLLGAVLALVIAAFGVFFAFPASAHDQLIGSNPENGATLDKQPEWIELEFSGAIQNIGNEIQVNTDGKNVSAGEITVDGHKVMSALPDDLEPGDYQVVWRVVSQDGHPISGTVDFTIKDSSAAGGAAGEATAQGTPGDTEAGGSAVGQAGTSANSATQPAGEVAQAPDSSATSGQSTGMSPWIYGVIAVAGLVALAVVIALFMRKSRGVTN